MVKAEGRVFEFDDVDKIGTDFLEAFAYEGGEQFIKYETDEFSAVCPFSGLPDIAKVIIEYIPTDKIIELKSLKYYYVSYRNVGIYQEAVTDKIYEDILALLNPTYLKITTVYNTRGGIDATCYRETK